MTSAAASRVWLITGATSGFGAAIARAVLDRGDIVVATGRRRSALDELVALAPDRVTGIEYDVTDIDRATTVVEEVIARHGRIDVLVNNAGMALIGAVEETTDAELRALMDVHFFGPAALTRAVLPHLRAQRSGAVVQMSSMGGRMSFPGVSAYSATKFALEGLSEALAAEVEPFGITVLVVEPGAFRTGLQGGAMRFSDEIADYASTVGATRAGMREVDGNQPGDPAKLASAILTALDAERPPLRLTLGSDAIDAVTGGIERARADLAEWESVGRSTTFDD